MNWACFLSILQITLWNFILTKHQRAWDTCLLPFLQCLILMSLQEVNNLLSSNEMFVSQSKISTRYTPFIEEIKRTHSSQRHLSMSTRRAIIFHPTKNKQTGITSLMTGKTIACITLIKSPLTQNCTWVFVLV